MRSRESTSVTEPPPIDAQGVRLWRARAAGEANARATPKLESRSMRSNAWRTPNRLSGGSTGSRAASAFFAEACSTWAALLAAADATIAGVGARRG